MTDRVVSLHGNTIEGEPDPEVIAQLEQLLAEAKAGTLTGIAFATTHSNRNVGKGWSGLPGTRFQLGGAIGMMQAGFNLMLLRED